MDMANTTSSPILRLGIRTLTTGHGLKVLALRMLGLLLFLIGYQVSAQSTLPVPSLSISSATTAYDPIQAGALLLGAGDLIDVQVFSTPELSGRMRIDQAGVVRLPIGGTLNLVGLEPADASGVFEEHLKDAQIMLDPHVTIFVVEYATQGVTVLGEVHSPGTYTLLGPHSLYDALSSAGGATSTQGASITVTHHNDPEHPVIVPLNSPNYSQLQRSTAVYPGDTIVVSKAFTISVVGDVTRSGTFYLQNGEPLSVLSAVALASGLNRTAKTSKASIIRPTASGAETIPVDLEKIMKNTAPNVMLQASDVLVIPRSRLKVFLETALPGATAAVVSATTSALIVR